MGTGGDLLDWLGGDMSVAVMKKLKDPADLVRISSVSRAWRRFAVANSFCKELCEELFPETSMFTGVEDRSLDEDPMIGCSSALERKNLEREHKIYACLVQSLLSPPVDNECIRRPIAASSTDNYPEESIDKTLQACHNEGEGPSYWSSEGESNTDVPETLTYCLSSRLCVIYEVNVHPFQADFQMGSPIYSAKAVRFKLGYPKVPLSMGDEVLFELMPNDRAADNNYIWTYISPEFPMMQIELLGRVQKQEMDALYYICVCHVQVVGRPLQAFDVDINAHSRRCILKYLPETENIPYHLRRSDDEAVDSSGWLSFATRIRQIRGTRGWNRLILRTFLGNDEDSDDHVSDDE
ncbi:F-box protein [Nymphaea thermarum]|nr:F-box protein [Nymphaea thermarum]